MRRAVVRIGALLCVRCEHVRRAAVRADEVCVASLCEVREGEVRAVRRSAKDRGNAHSGV